MDVLNAFVLCVFGAFTVAGAIVTMSKSFRKAIREDQSMEER